MNKTRISIDGKQIDLRVYDVSCDPVNIIKEILLEPVSIH
jgi:hypothetical protein